MSMVLLLSSFAQKYNLIWKKPLQKWKRSPSRKEVVNYCEFVQKLTHCATRDFCAKKGLLLLKQDVSWKIACGSVIYVSKPRSAARFRTIAKLGAI